MIKVNANLFRIAYAAVSTEETRYYLKGVFVEPNPIGGVNLVATDGHRLLCIHDKFGKAEKAAIIALSKKGLKAYKPKISKFTRSDYRQLSIDEKGAAFVKAFSHFEAGEYFGTETIVHGNTTDSRIDGTFPDYRRILPAGIEHGKSGAFNASYLGAFADTANELAAEHGIATGILRVICNNPKSAALILFNTTELAFGVLMPTLGLDRDSLPDWIKSREKA
jgi:hypothetical protein